MALTKTEKKDLSEWYPQRGQMILSLTQCRRYHCFGKCDMDKSVTAVGEHKHKHNDGDEDKGNYNSDGSNHDHDHGC